MKIGKTVYSVEIMQNRVRAEEIVYPLSGYSNNYGTGYEIDLNYSKGWAKAKIYCWNSTWATRGHGLTDSWIDSQGYIRKGEARKIFDSVKQKLSEAENGTPDVKAVFNFVRDIVTDACEEY